MSAGAVEEEWQEVDYDAAWSPFLQRFGFEADFHERRRPAIRLDSDCVVVDLAPIYDEDGARFVAAQAAVNAVALRCFVWLSGDEDADEMRALDWQHAAYRYSPSAHALVGADWPVQVFPDGDYYVHMTPDARWGTFGHPWQQSLCIWGRELIDSLGTELLSWLPRHEQSPA